MKKQAITILMTVSIALLIFSGTGWAQNRFNERQDRQRNRIHQGIDSGELTRKESRVLRYKQKQINKYNRHANADGRFSPRERKQLNRMQKHQSRRIYNYKHNNRDRNWHSRHLTPKQHRLNALKYHRGHRYPYGPCAYHIAGSRCRPIVSFSFSTGGAWD